MAPSNPRVESPCTKVCTLDPQQVCLGCGRQIDEIVEWPQASEARRREIVRLAAQRRAVTGRGEMNAPL